MLEELKETELREINGGCESCYENGRRLREMIDVAWTILLRI
ncbi:hypothetical protein [Flavobacterium sp.]|nr:hypothetical protein [Flavobacterium sp.]